MVKKILFGFVALILVFLGGHYLLKDTNKSGVLVVPEQHLSNDNGQRNDLYGDPYNSIIVDNQENYQAKEVVLEVSVIPSIPRTAEITGPDELVQVSKGFSQGMPFAGCLYSINWGDGTTEPNEASAAKAPYCASDLRHTYDQKGSYKIKIQTWGQGPSDGPVPGLSAEKIVIIN